MGAPVQRAVDNRAWLLPGGTYGLLVLQQAPAVKLTGLAAYGPARTLHTGCCCACNSCIHPAHRVLLCLLLSYVVSHSARSVCVDRKLLILSCS
jgi:hypothetical protein